MPLGGISMSILWCSCIAGSLLEVPSRYQYDVLHLNEDISHNSCLKYHLATEWLKIIMY